MYDTDGWVPTEDSGGLYSPDVQTTQGQGTFQAAFTLGNDLEWNNYGNGEMYSSLFGKFSSCALTIENTDSHRIESTWPNSSIIWAKMK